MKVGCKEGYSGPSFRKGIPTNIDDDFFLLLSVMILLDVSFMLLGSVPLLIIIQISSLIRLLVPG